MRQNLNWGVNPEQFTSLNTRGAQDEILDTELVELSNFDFEELGALRKIGGNEVVFASTVDYQIKLSEYCIKNK